MIDHPHLQDPPRDGRLNSVLVDAETMAIDNPGKWVRIECPSRGVMASRYTRARHHGYETTTRIIDNHFFMYLRTPEEK